MLETYKAVLRGGKIEWKSDAPKALDGDKPIEVFITILDNSKETKTRPYGLGKGDFTVPEDFDASLPEEILLSFEQ